jgi:transcription elongation GreA/GreB family factor
MKEKIEYKKRLHQYCMAIIQQRINATLQAMQNAQAAANSEEKSSAGDKYETSRAMSHLEKDMHARQLAANQNELAALLAVDTNSIHASVTTGSIVTCNNVTFYIAAGLGKISFENDTVYILSPNAPVAKSLLNKVIGNRVNFNNKEIIIEAIF